MKTDATCYNIRLQNDNVYILPDRIIVKGKKGWGAIEYSDLDIVVESRTFIEDGAVPKDAEVIGYTWQYVNKNGSPDKRYKNNRQLPQCNYGSLTIVSGTAMNVLLYTSSISHTKKFLSIMNSMIKDAEEAKKSVPEQAVAEQMSLEENADNTEQPMLQYSPYANTDGPKEQTQNEKAATVGRMVNALKASYENFLPDGIIEDEKEILLAYWEGLKENNLPTITTCIRRADGSIGVTYKGKDIGSFYVCNNDGWLIHNVGNNGKTNRIEGNLDELKKNVTKWHRYIINQCHLVNEYLIKMVEV